MVLQVRVLWWGDTSGGTLLPVSVPAPETGSGASRALPAAASAAAASAAEAQPQGAKRGGSALKGRPAGARAVRFGVCCGPQHLAAYLADAGTLSLTLEDAFCGLLGEAAVPLAELAAGAPVSVTVCVTARGGANACSSDSRAPGSGEARTASDQAAESGAREVGVQGGGSGADGLGRDAGAEADVSAEGEGAEDRPIARLSVQLSVTFPMAAAAFAGAGVRLGSAAPARAQSPQASTPRLAEPSLAVPEEPRRADAVPAPLPQGAAGRAGGAAHPSTGGGDGSCDKATLLSQEPDLDPTGHALASGGGANVGAGPFSVSWTGYAVPGYPETHAWQPAAYFGALTAGQLAAWQRWAQQAPPAWSRRSPPAAAQPILAPAWPAYVQPSWHAAPDAAQPLGPGLYPGLLNALAAASAPSHLTTAGPRERQHAPSKAATAQPGSRAGRRGSVDPMKGFRRQADSVSASAGASRGAGAERAGKRRMANRVGSGRGVRGAAPHAAPGGQRRLRRAGEALHRRRPLGKEHGNCGGLTVPSFIR